MHESALEDARRFVAKYLDCTTDLTIADVGSFDVNGTLRPLFADIPSWTYTGFDLEPGPNVDVTLSSPYSWPEIATGSFGVVVSTQVMEHVRHPWRWLPEVARICKPGGLVYVCTPNTIEFHEYPIDCWRAWPDGLRALFEDAGLEIVDVYASGIDTTGIGRKP